MPKIKLCAFADESGAKAEVQIDNLLKNGVYAVEMRSCDSINVSEFTQDKAAEVYEKFADFKVQNSGTIEQAADEIVRRTEDANTCN